MSIENKRDISLTANEAKFLGAALMTLCKASQSDPSAVAAYASLYMKSQKLEGTYSGNEIALLSRIVFTTLKAGDNLLAKTTDLEARIKANAVAEAFRSVQEKLKNEPVQQSAEGQLHPQPCNFSGDHQERPAEDHRVPGSAGCGSPDGGAPEECEPDGRGEAANLPRQV
jgi:hypothetical protein